MAKKKSTIDGKEKVSKKPSSSAARSASAIPPSVPSPTTHHETSPLGEPDINANGGVSSSPPIMRHPKYYLDEPDVALVPIRVCFTTRRCLFIAKIHPPSFLILILAGEYTLPTSCDLLASTFGHVSRHAALRFRVGR